MVETVCGPSVVDPEQFPFRAQLGYDEYGQNAGLIASSQVDTLREAVIRGDITDDEKELYNRHAFDIVRAFVEYGYESRVLRTLKIDEEFMGRMMHKAAESNFAWVSDDMLYVPDEASPTLKLSLDELCRRAYLWGRTGNPFDETAFGEPSVLAAQTT